VTSNLPISQQCDTVIATEAPGLPDPIGSDWYALDMISDPVFPFAEFGTIGVDGLFPTIDDMPATARFSVFDLSATCSTFPVLPTYGLSDYLGMLEKRDIPQSFVPQKDYYQAFEQQSDNIWNVELNSSGNIVHQNSAQEYSNWLGLPSGMFQSLWPSWPPGEQCHEAPSSSWDCQHLNCPICKHSFNKKSEHTWEDHFNHCISGRHQNHRLELCWSDMFKEHLETYHNISTIEHWSIPSLTRNTIPTVSETDLDQISLSESLQYTGYRCTSNKTAEKARTADDIWFCCQCGYMKYSVYDTSWNDESNGLHWSSSMSNSSGIMQYNTVSTATTIQGCYRICNIASLFAGTLLIIAGIIVTTIGTMTILEFLIISLMGRLERTVSMVKILILGSIFLCYSLETYLFTDTGFLTKSYSHDNCSFPQKIEIFGTIILSLRNLAGRLGQTEERSKILSYCMINAPLAVLKKHSLVSLFLMPVRTD
jgi:hypothetical protein